MKCGKDLEVEGSPGGGGGGHPQAPGEDIQLVLQYPDLRGAGSSGGKDVQDGHYVEDDGKYWH